MQDQQCKTFPLNFYIDKISVKKMALKNGFSENLTNSIKYDIINIYSKVGRQLHSAVVASCFGWQKISRLWVLGVYCVQKSITPECFAGGSFFIATAVFSVARNLEK